MENRFIIEQQLQSRYDLVIGVDEVGRGTLAGPVVAAAVSFEEPIDEGWWGEIKDSKKISEKKREALAKFITETANYGIGVATVQQIEALNILQASLVAMRLAVKSLLKTDDTKAYILIDGTYRIPGVRQKQETFIKGDNIVHSVAAASILAKVTRDNMMRDYDLQYPGYDFGKHKGYATKFHRGAIKELGLSPIHRPSFCRKIVS